MKLIKNNKKLSVLLVMMLLVTAIGWLGLSERTQAAAPSLGESLIVGDANGNGEFNIQDLVRIKRYVQDSTAVACYLDGDLNVDGNIGENDDVRCREMLVTGDHSLKVDVNESNRAKVTDDTDGYYTYYNLKKGLKAGQTITFKIELPSAVTDYGVYGFYTGADYWVELPKNADASNTYRLVPNVEIKQVQLRVVNKSTNEPVAFKIYDIQVYATSAGGAVTDMEVLYQQNAGALAVYGTRDSLDLTKFSVGTASQDLTYTWSLKKPNGTVVNNLNMTETAYSFDAAGTYTITATVDKTTGYSGSASQTIYVVAPQVFVGFDNGAVANTGTYTSATASLKGLTENDKGACTSTSFENYSGKIEYVPGIDGDLNGAFKTNRQSGAITVVNGYSLPADNFTISTWFNKEVDTTDITTGSGEFLFGNANPDGTSGFSVTLKRMTNSDIHQLRFKFGDSSALWVDVDIVRYGWNNLTISVSEGILSVYMNGEKVEDVTMPKDYSFGSTPVALGAYPVESGKTFTYVERSIFFDDLQIYNTVLDANTISAIASSDNKGADVIVNYNSNQIENTGFSSATVGVYTLNATKNSTAFKAYDKKPTYVDGFQNESGEAFKSNHKNGPYTVVDGYDFGTKNFTVSTWFKIPEGQTLSTGNSAFIMGTSHPDDTNDGFRLTFRSESDSYWFAFKAANGNGNDQKKLKFADFTFDEWHNVVVTREGANMRLFVDGTLLMNTFDIPASFSFGSKSLALGAYTGFPHEYHPADIYYDDLRVYDGILCLGEIKDMYSTKVADPTVSLSYTKGSMENAGSNSHATVGAYKLSKTADVANHFVASEVLPFTAGAADDAYGAFASDHRDGSYTVVRDHVLGRNNFTINTWFNITDTSKLDDSAGYYLFGLRNPNGGLGFSVALKKSEIRFKVGSDVNNVSFPEWFSEWESNTWYHMSLRRKGSELTLFLNGKPIHTETGISSDYGTEDLAFGAYYGFGNEYKDAITLFDEIRIYDVALSDKVIEEAAKTTLEDGVAIATDYTTSTSNSGTMYVNAGQRKAWDPGIIYIEEGEYAGLYCMYVAHENKIVVSTSKDLVNWSQPVPCFEPLKDVGVPTVSGSWIYNYVWAPEVVYENGTYYLFFSAQMKDNTSVYRALYKHIGVATSTDPTKGFTQYTDAGATTNQYDGKIHISEPLFGTSRPSTANAAEKASKYHGQGFIDAHPFVDPKTGDKYLYMVRNRDGQAEGYSDSNIIAVVKMTTWTKPDYSTYKELTKVGYTTVNGSTKTEVNEGSASTNNAINEAPQMFYRDGKYYLTYSITSALEPTYSVMQAVGDSPTGPFTKIQQSKGGALLRANLASNYVNNKISGTGHHYLIERDDEVYIMYHQHTYTNDPTESVKMLGLDRVYFVKNADNQTIMKSNGPTRSMQPMPSFATGYYNVAKNATFTASVGANNIGCLTDDLVKYNANDITGQFETASALPNRNPIQLTITFDDYVKARAILLYNSYDKNTAFTSVDNITVSYRKIVDGVARTGKMSITDQEGATSFTYKFDSLWTNDNGKYLSTGAPLALEFNEMEIIDITMDVYGTRGQKLAISEIMVLGQGNEAPDVHIDYQDGAVNYATSNLGLKVGSYALNQFTNASSFVEKLDARFTYGVDGIENSALITSHRSGPYAVVDKYNFGTKDFTISTWFKIPENTEINTGGSTYIFGTDQPDTTTGIAVSLNPGQLRYRIGNSGTLRTTKDGIDTSTNTWHHIALVRKGTSMRLYYDGKEVANYAVAADQSFGEAYLAFGGHLKFGYEYMPANMYYDDVQVYGRALTKTKIQEIYNQY